MKSQSLTEHDNLESQVMNNCDDSVAIMRVNRNNLVKTNYGPTSHNLQQFDEANIYFLPCWPVSAAHTPNKLVLKQQIISSLSSTVSIFGST